MATPPKFSDVQPGDALPTYVHENVTRTDLVKYAGASGDYNPMHHDEKLATSVGMPSVFAHGMFSMGLLSNVLVRWAGPGAVRRFDVQFRAITWPDDPVTCTGTVKGKREAGGEKLVDVDLLCETKPGTKTIIGAATVALPA
jgi:acyl dehydratase